MTAAGGYRPPLRDIAFTLTHLSPVPELAALPAFVHVEQSVVDGVLREAGRFAAEVVAPTNHEGDRTGAVLDGDAVRIPPAVRRAYERFVDAGWGALAHPAEYGGGEFPLTVAVAVREMLASANLAFSMAPTLNGGVAHLLVRHGSPDQCRRYVPHLVSGRWTGTMAITEPQAGSDLGPIATTARPDGAGGYRVSGQKIFISYGDHDLTRQIVHLVLARTPDAPPGAKGLSLFVVPKWRLGPDGEPGERNAVRVLGLEHKLGIRASPTCVMAFDEAHAEIVGAPHDGLRQMFTMMNDARLGVALQGLGVAERAFQQALAFARDRRQGRADGATVAIVSHPDVRRTLLTMKAHLEAMRGLCYVTAHAVDLATHHPDATVRAERAARAELLTPIAKAWCTDSAVELTSLAVQVHGGMGFVEETGVAQHYRDVRITPIYEGTNGIQALDLVHRKLPAVPDLLGEIDATVRGLPPRLSAIGGPLGSALGALRSATGVLAAADPGRRAEAATPYLRGFGLVLGAWLLARGARAAGGAGEFGRGRLLTARFFADHVLPQAAAHFASVHAEPAPPGADLVDLWQAGGGR